MRITHKNINDDTIEGFEVETDEGWVPIIFVAKYNLAWSKEPVKNARKVRFLQRNYMYPHLYNSLGLPALPFMEKEL